MSNVKSVEKPVIYGGDGPRIAVVGGGTGLSVILRGIKKITENVAAIVTVADDGGGSGVLRRELKMLPPGDIRNCISALSTNEGVMDELLQFRFHEGRLKGQNMGNLIIAGLFEMYGDFQVAVDKMHEILRVTGRVLPVTTDRVNLWAELEDGTVVKGESRIPRESENRCSGIKKIHINPVDPEATEGALWALNHADMIVLGPGSLYTSIIPNLLVKDVKDAIANSSAIKLYICNVMTQAGETVGYTVSDCVNAIEEYLGEGIIQYLAVNRKVLQEALPQQYVDDGLTQILMTREDKANMIEKGIETIESNFIKVTPEGIICHDADRVAGMIQGFLSM